VTPLHSSTGEPIHTLTGHVDMVSALQMTSDCRCVSGGRDGMLFLWQTGGREEQEDDEEGGSEWMSLFRDNYEPANTMRVGLGGERQREPFRPDILRVYRGEG
jgi:WD40 repeat protein